MIDECEHQGRGAMPTIHNRRPLGRELDPKRGRRGRGELFDSKDTARCLDMLFSRGCPTDPTMCPTICGALLGDQGVFLREI